MKLDDILKNIQDKFGSKVLKCVKKNEKRAYIDIYPKDVVGFTKYIFKDLGLRFNIASAVVILTPWRYYTISRMMLRAM